MYTELDRRLLDTRGPRGPRMAQCGQCRPESKEVEGTNRARTGQPGWHPAHLHTELPDLQLQLPHLGLAFSHHGPQLGHKAAAPLGLTVDLLVQVVLGCTSRFLLHTQAAQNVLQLLELVLRARQRAGRGSLGLLWVGKDRTGQLASLPRAI